MSNSDQEIAANSIFGKDSTTVEPISEDRGKAVKAPKGASIADSIDGIDPATANLDRIIAEIDNGFATFDRQWRYTYVNNRLLAIFELPRAAVLGKPAWEVFPDRVGIEEFDLLNRSMTERVEVQFEYYYSQVERWIEHRVYPTADGLAILMADVSDRSGASCRSLPVSRAANSLCGNLN